MDTLTVPSMWTLDEALSLVRSLQPEIRQFGYHLCLGGGVLNAGHSRKDLDLYFLQMDGRWKPLPTDLIKWLVSVWGDGQEIVASQAGVLPEGGIVRVANADGEMNYPPADPASPYKAKLKFNWSGLRIDAFVL